MVVFGPGFNCSATFSRDAGKLLSRFTVFLHEGARHYSPGAMMRGEYRCIQAGFWQKKRSQKPCRYR